MTTKSKSSLLVLLLFVFAGALIYGEYQFGKTIMELRRSIETLTQQRVVLERTALEQTRQISVFKKALAELETIIQREGDRTRALRVMEEIKGCLLSLLL